MELASLAQLAVQHRRHDEVMQGLLAAARRLAAGRPDGGDLEVVREAVEYFDKTVTRHFLDEEGSLFPRLSTRLPELSEALAKLSAEHPDQIALQTEIATVAKGLDGESRPAAGKALLEAASKLAAVHEAHVKREDALFASANGALTAEDDAEIVAEMGTRRDRAPLAPPREVAQAKAKRQRKETVRMPAVKSGLRSSVLGPRPEKTVKKTKTAAKSASKKPAKTKAATSGRRPKTEDRRPKSATGSRPAKASSTSRRSRRRS